VVFTVRTPDERFADLPEWPYQRRHVQVDQLRLARVDQVPPAGPDRPHPVVLVHGEPTWGYLWRKVLPPLLDAGLRTVVPDQVGFGRSDKPARRDWYSYDRLVDSFAAHLDALDLEPVTLVVHDWGGIVGLRWAVEHPERVARLVLLNTALWTPGGRHSEAWLRFRRFVERAEELPIGRLIDGAALTDLPDRVLAAYEAPFHEPAAQAGALALPLLVPLSDQDPGARQMHQTGLQLLTWDKPALVLWGADDPILPPVIGERFARDLPGAGELETVRGAHFLQEDAGHEIGERIARFVGDT
jgi:haloalkane dehalogenase